jgi:hypothetical protein
MFSVLGYIMFYRFCLQGPQCQKLIFPEGLSVYNLLSHRYTLDTSKKKIGKGVGSHYSLSFLPGQSVSS